MRKIAEFVLADGSTLLAEVEPDEFARAHRDSAAVVRGVADGIVERAAFSFDDALAKLRPAAEAIITRLRSLAEPPDTVDIEFGLKLSASLGAILASGSGEGNISVRLSWKRAEKPPAAR